MPRPTLSLVLPIYNEEEVIPLLHERLREFLDRLGLDCEVVFVNDGSSDRSLEMLREIATRDVRYKVLSFSRNFGHQSAITAGVDYAKGAAVVVMDADLQDPPEVVLEMVDQWRAGYDVVYAQRLTRTGESWFKLVTARWFYRFFRAMIPIEVPLDTGDFRLMSRKVVLILRQLRETHRFVRGVVAWIGFKQTAVLYDRPGRAAGDTKYPLRKMLRFAVDGITSFSILPLRFATYLGMVISFFAALIAVWAVIAKLTSHTVEGWTATVVLVSFFAGVQLLMTGILGEYVGRIYEQVKERPLYVVSDRVNLAAHPDTDEVDEIDPRANLPLPPRPEVAVALESSARAHLAPPTPLPGVDLGGVDLGRPQPGTSRPEPSPASLPQITSKHAVKRPQTLLGVSPHPIAPAPFPAVPATSTMIMPVEATKEGVEIAKAAQMGRVPPTKTAPGMPVAHSSDVPPPPQFVTAPMKQLPPQRPSRPPPPLPKKG